MILKLLILIGTFIQSVCHILELCSCFDEIQLIHFFYHVTYSCVLPFLLDFKVAPEYLLCSSILNSSSIAANDIIPFASVSSGLHNTPTQDSLQSIRISIFTGNEINCFQSLRTICSLLYGHMVLMDVSPEISGKLSYYCMFLLYELMLSLYSIHIRVYSSLKIACMLNWKLTVKLAVI